MAQIETLKTKLSANARITTDRADAPEWSDFGGFKTANYVHVSTEDDVIETIKYCSQNNLRMLFRSGGHSWNLKGDYDIVVNMRALNNVKIADDQQSVTFGGGAIVKEVDQILYDNKLQSVLGYCNDIGLVASLSGGGLGRGMGQFGLGCDQILSVDIIDANGKKHTVTKDSNADIFWALKGAGMNLGAITSMTIKIYPLTSDDGKWWNGMLIFDSTAENMRKVCEAFNEIVMEPKMALYMMNAIPPQQTEPMIVALPFYCGTEAEGRLKFKKILDLEPIEMMGMVPDIRLNDMTDLFCTKGGRKPGATMGLDKLDPDTFVKVLEKFKEFLKLPGTSHSAFMVERFPTDKMKENNDGLYPHRDVNFQTFIIPWYYDEALDEKAVELSKGCRTLWRETSGLPDIHNYINFGLGDEEVEHIYGKNNIARLKDILKKWDPKGMFRQVYPIDTSN